jgi:hypothetical protein
MKKFTYEISFLTTVIAQDEDKSLEALERKFPTNNGLVSFHNVASDEIYCTLFELRNMDGTKLSSSLGEEE